jgi:hypothetical protein
MKASILVRLIAGNRGLTQAPQHQVHLFVHQLAAECLGMPYIN